jgi:hypothetical protein
LEQKEENLTTPIHDLKQSQKTIPILEKLRIAQEMKNLQIEVKNIQEERQTRQAHLEPLQEQVEQMITTLETEKTSME